MAVIGDILFLVLLVIAAALGAPVLIYWTYRQARRKGYRPPAAILIILVALGAGIAGAVAHKGNSNTWSTASAFWHALGLPVLLGSIALVLLVRVVPHRTVRVFGERKTRFPFRGVGRVVQVFAVVVALLGVLVAVSTRDASSSIWQIIGLAVMLWAAGRYMVGEARALHAPAVEEVIHEDQRAPVLYLRAFNQESQYFVIGSKSVYGKWAKSFLSEIAQGGQKIGLTLEEYLSQDLNTSMGPFVALGSPEDYLAPPGALRLYAKDDEWKARFDELARRAACIIVEVSKSDNLRWEFEHLRAEKLQEKLFVLTRPSTEGSHLAWAYWGMLWRVRGIRSMTWPEFLADLQKLGYEIHFDDPGVGAVLGFDEQGKGFVLNTEGQWPQDFVGPIHAWITERRKKGRCIEAKCAKCGREVYAREGEATPLCYDCRVGSNRRQRSWQRVRGIIKVTGLMLIPVAFALLVGIVFPGSWLDRQMSWVLPVIVVLGLVFYGYISNRKKKRAEGVNAIGQ